MRKVVPVLLVTLCLLLLTGAASATSVTVAQQENELYIEVTDNGEPVEGASVTVAGVEEETPLDGEYVTDEDGLVVFGSDVVKELEGVVHLRITVEKDGVIKSSLSTITRGSETGSAPLGQRVSMGLHESTQSTRGKIEGRMNAAKTDDVNVSDLGEDVDQILASLGEARFEREVISRDLAAGEITTNGFYLRTVKNTGQIAFLRSALGESVRYLGDYDDDTLAVNGIETVELERLRLELERDRVIDTDRRVSR